MTRLRRVQVGVNQYKEPVYELVESSLPGALFAPKDVVPAVEPGRLPTVTEPTLYWRNEWPDVVASDVLRVRGVDYEVQTVPADWRGDAVGGLVVKLRDTEEGVP